MRSLITGATGFVGANLARRLLRDGHEVHALVRPQYNGWRIDEVRTDLRLHVVPLDDAAAVMEAARAIRPEWVFHLAVHGAYSSQTDMRQMVTTNLISTLNLLEACAAVGFETFVNTGSSSEYGFKDHPPREDEFIDPNSAYAVTKAAATHACRFFAASRKLNICTLRLYSVYGAYEEPTRLIPTLIARGLRGELPPLVNPNIARDYIYTADVEDAYLLAAAAQHNEAGAVYNVGRGVQISLREAVDVARTTLKIAQEPEWGTMPDRQWDTSVWVSDPSKLEQTLGWRARWSFADGFAATANWLRAARAHHARYGVLP